MRMLSELVSQVIGVDTHKEAHTVAVVSSVTGGVSGIESHPASRSGYAGMVEFADGYSDASDRAWAIEGTGSYGAGLTAFLKDRGEWVIEVDRPGRHRDRDRSKSDSLDAVRAARDALGRKQWAQPRAGGEREALRVLLAVRDGAVKDRTRAINQLKGTIVTAPDELRAKLRRADGARLLKACTGLRIRGEQPSEYQATVLAIKRLAARIRRLEAEIRDHERDIAAITGRVCPRLEAQPGLGPLTAAQAYVSWSHHGRCRSEAAFAKLGGAAPIPASSGEVVRFRLNRGGDRQLNRALHTIAITRARYDTRTKEYVARRVAEGKSEREVRRCLKRYIARQIFRILEADARSHQLSLSR